MTSLLARVAPRLISGVLALACAAPALAGPSAMRQERAEAMIDKAIAYLRTQQDPATGGWSVPPAGKGQPNLPAITGLVLSGMLLQPGVDARDPSIAKGTTYILSFAKDDGGIYDSILPSYNTAICLSALAKIDTPEAKARIKPAQDFLRNQQWGSATPVGMNAPGKYGDEAPESVDPSHPHYGGLGYGNKGRPDISNLSFAVQAWHDSGLPTDDPAFQRAIVFLQRCQMIEKAPDGTVINDREYAKGSRQGGFIYSVSTNNKNVGIGETNAGMIEETLDDGTKVSRFRAYGTVTYAGFKSYLYAGLSPSDPRVQAALDWVRSNYTFAENPALGTDGYYYFLIMSARALDALGVDTLDVTGFAVQRQSLDVTNLPPGATSADVEGLAGLPKPQAIAWWDAPADQPRSATLYFGKDEDAQKAREIIDATTLKNHRLVAHVSTQIEHSGSAPVGVKVNWRDDLIDHLARLQNPDGSFRSIDDRWMENNPTLITAYALIALQHAAREQKN